MNLYRIAQTENDNYDTFDSAIVAAKDEMAARRIHPCTYAGPDRDWSDDRPNKEWGGTAYHTWASHPDKVTASLIGEAAPGTPEGVVLASFNAG